MTRSNRVLNRIVLALLGVVLVAAGLVALFSSARGPLRDAGVPTSWSDGLEAPLAAASRLTPTTWALWATAAVALVVVVLAAVWAASRGRGGTSVVVREHADAAGVTVNVALVRALLERAVPSDGDIASVHADAFEARGGARLVRVTVGVRRDGDAVAARERVVAGLAEVERQLGRTVPTLVHLAAARVASTGSRVR